MKLSKRIESYINRHKNGYGEEIPISKELLSKWMKDAESLEAENKMQILNTKDRSELEQNIIKTAQYFIDKMPIDYDFDQHGSHKEMKFSFYCDGVMDFLIYDNELKMFTKIIYRKGVGKAYGMNLPGHFGAYFDESEQVEIDLTEKVMYI